MARNNVYVLMNHTGWGKTFPNTYIDSGLNVTIRARTMLRLSLYTSLHNTMRFESGTRKKQQDIKKIFM